MTTTETRSDANPLARIEVLDQRLSYRCFNPNGSPLMTFRSLGDGRWRLCQHAGEAERETSLMLNAAGTKRQLDDWRALCGTVLPFACFCAKCSPPELRAFQNSVGNVSHGLWPECEAQERQRMAAEVGALLARQGSACAA